MSPESFVHLHVHSEYSTLDSTIRTKELVARAAELGMPAVAITDHGNLYAAVEFYQNAVAAGIKPILGCEIYLAPASLRDKKEIPGRKNSTHLTLLAKNEAGWKNLVKLVSIGHLEGEYLGEPRVDREHLAKYAEGLICLSGCIHGAVNEWLHQHDPKAAQTEIMALCDIFGKEDFYLELNDQGLEIQQEINVQLKGFAEDLGLKMVATNDVHFLEKEDAEAQDVLLCIGEGRLLLDENRKRYPAEHYFKSSEEMRELFAEFPGACDASLEIAEKCNVELKLDPTSSEKYPQFDSPDGSPREDYFRKVCYEGLDERYPAEKLEQLAGQQNITTDEVSELLDKRLDYEIKTINELGFASYFLITADFIQWGRDHDIPVGPGRGSAAGSLVAYTMGITNICPIRFGLLFERFLNPERVSPPDVDIDFCQSRRPEVIDYVRDKYGERSVSHIITYGTLGAKSVIRDVARVMGISYGDADMLAKMIEAKPGVKLKDEYDEKQELRDIIENSSTWQELWSYATKLEGLNRNTGVHAAGIVIGDRDLDEHCALTRGNDGEVVTQCDMNAITEVGLLKMDFLGLKNLTVIQDAVNYIRQHTPEFDIDEIPLDDKPALDLLNRGETMGVFQLESGGMVETCRKYGIQKIDDIIDLLALYRPGAMDYIDQMIEVKKGLKPVNYEHPLLEDQCPGAAQGRRRPELHGEGGALWRVARKPLLQDCAQRDPGQADQAGDQSGGVPDPGLQLAPGHECDPCDPQAHAQPLYPDQPLAQHRACDQRHGGGLQAHDQRGHARLDPPFDRDEDAAQIDEVHQRADQRLFGDLTPRQPARPAEPDPGCHEDRHDAEAQTEEGHRLGMRQAQLRADEPRAPEHDEQGGDEGRRRHGQCRGAEGRGLAAI